MISLVEGQGLCFVLDSADLLCGAALPEDYEAVVSARGDKFRDDFTRRCLYLGNKHAMPAEPGRTTVVVGTEYGNLAAMLRLQRLAAAGERRISAQQFPHATTSSASVFLNIERGFTGGNATLNAGALTPVVALLQGALHVNAYTDAASAVLAGDTYCAEALDDVRKTAADHQVVTPGVLWAGLRTGDDYEAVFSFGATATATGFPESGPIFRDRDENGRPDAEWNRAFLAYDFLTALKELPVGASAVLQLSHDERSATVRVTRRRA
ncbi:hypothetical protein ABZX66_18435 [Micromonospora aurantiaca]|uniref:hypothetical protein n=1 Tax=Micromonospora aurantiaca (nom. illeg.) TaxID=47850 RepID=UPI0033B77FBD